MIHRLRSLRGVRFTMPALIVALAMFLIVPACGDDNPTDTGGGAFDGTITLSGTSFSPSSATIKAGESVTWVWSGGTHSVTNGTDPNLPETRLFDEGPKSSGSFTFTFNTPGTYPFFCRPHFTMGMKGTITVTN